MNEQDHSISFITFLEIHDSKHGSLRGGKQLSSLRKEIKRGFLCMLRRVPESVALLVDFLFKAIRKKQRRFISS